MYKCSRLLLLLLYDVETNSVYCILLITLSKIFYWNGFCQKLDFGLIKFVHRKSLGFGGNSDFCCCRIKCTNLISPSPQFCLEMQPKCLGSASLQSLLWDRLYIQTISTENTPVSLLSEHLGTSLVHLAQRCKWETELLEQQPQWSTTATFLNW